MLGLNCMCHFPVCRTSKYSVYLATKASQDKFVDRVRNAFGGPPGAERAIVVVWGNWGGGGSHPNALRNQGPTPGIGFRRFVHRRLVNDRRHGKAFRGNTLTTFEGMTSSVCNDCGHRVANVVTAEGAQGWTACFAAKAQTAAGSGTGTVWATGTS
jgi:hypothetical protein